MLGICCCGSFGCSLLGGWFNVFQDLSRGLHDHPRAFPRSSHEIFEVLLRRTRVDSSGPFRTSPSINLVHPRYLQENQCMHINRVRPGSPSGEPTRVNRDHPGPPQHQSRSSRTFLRRTKTASIAAVQDIPRINRVHSGPPQENQRGFT